MRNDPESDPDEDPGADDVPVAGASADGDEADGAAGAIEEVPEQVLRLEAAGLLSDDLTVAEVAATDGPTYALDDLDPAVVANLVGRLQSAGIQWAIDGAGSLIVHVNDERRADEVFDEVFGPDGEEASLGDDRAPRSDRAGTAPLPDPAVEVARVPRLLVLLALVAVVVLAAVLLG